ncbi:10306_t:CDS:2 [Acaulospora colombiana]|uniref:10306_t:CDS:1 n=1 Tax=Acaulospora colombiana TaxID=27376 RepID=A0ACA9LHX1_9GLOM|nr:10306_t:CDS:2 [Acaulospora colombiana]
MIKSYKDVKDINQNYETFSTDYDIDNSTIKRTHTDNYDNKAFDQGQSSSFLTFPQSQIESNQEINHGEKDLHFSTFNLDYSDFSFLESPSIQDENVQIDDNNGGGN